MTLLTLFFEFFKTGLFAVGGGAATIPFLMKMAERFDWFTKSELLDMIAVSESTPGPIGVNMATYAGFKTAGIPGALTATFALVLPAFLVMLIIAKLFIQYKENQHVQSVFKGIRPAVAALIANAAVSVLQTTIFLTENGKLHFRISCIVLFLVILIAMNIKKLRALHPVVWIGICAAAGIVLKL